MGTTQTLDDVLEHYGIKGMRWGVRRSDEELARQAGRTVNDGPKKKIVTKEDKKWAKQVSSSKEFIRVNNAMADRLNGPNGELARINNKPEYKNADLSDYSKGVGKKYLREVEGTYNKILQDISKDIPDSPSGLSANFRTNYKDYGMLPQLVVVKTKEVKHDDDGIVIGLVWDENGRVVSMGKIEHFDSLDDVLSHYGIKGMRWGVRRTDEQLARARGRRKTKEEAPKKSEDAEAAEVAKKKAKKSGVKALSNQELQQLNQRLNLEQQYNRLNAKNVSAGQKFINGMLADLAKKQATEFANAQVSSYLKKKTGG